MCVIDVCFTLIYTISGFDPFLPPASGWEELSQWCISVVEQSPHCWRVEWQMWWSGSMWCRDAFRSYIVHVFHVEGEARKRTCGPSDGVVWFTWCYSTTWSTCMLLWWWQTISRNGFDIILPTCIDAYSPKIQHVQTPVTIRDRVARCAFSWSWGLLEPFAIRGLAALRACCCVVEQLERHWVVCCQPAMPCWRICILRRRFDQSWGLGTSHTGKIKR